MRAIPFRQRRRFRPGDRVIDACFGRRLVRVIDSDAQSYRVRTSSGVEYSRSHRYFEARSEHDYDYPPTSPTQMGYYDEVRS